MPVFSPKFTILMFNMSYYHDWECGIRNRNYFILQELLRRPEIEHIIAIDYLPVTWRKKVVSIWYLVFSMLTAKHKVIHRDTVSTLTKINNKLSVFTLCSIKNVSTKLNHILNTKYKIQNTKTILWSYFPFCIGYFDNIKASLRVFDAVDDWSEHPNYQKQSQLLKNNYQRIKQKADIIFTVSQDLRNKLFHDQKNVYWIPNGANVKIQMSNVKSNPKSKCQMKNATIGYVGTIQSRVDFRLVRYLAERHPAKEFVFVGPVWSDAETDQVKGLQNVKFVGRVPYDDLPKYLSRFDIGIIPHKVDDFTRSMDPMKFYEYLVFGLPVISTQKLVQDKSLLYWADSYNNFSRAVDQAMLENSIELVRKRQRFAKANSWKERVEKMMSIVTAAFL